MYVMFSERLHMKITPARMTLAGAAVLMACACGAGANSARLLNMCGIGVTPKITHPLILSAAVVLILRGLWQIRRRAAWLAVISFVALAAAAAITPPSIMSSEYQPWHEPYIGGAILYLIFAAALGYAFWIAFPTPSPRPFAKLLALTGTALATGCSCCMVTGAIAGLGVTAGAGPTLFHGFTYFAGIGLAAVGLLMLRGFRPIPWLIAGGLIGHYGGSMSSIFGNWMVGDVNLRFIPGYFIYLIGAGLILKAWAVAYEPVIEKAEVAPIAPEPAF
jgi:hypothetical protein